MSLLTLSICVCVYVCMCLIICHLSALLFIQLTFYSKTWLHTDTTNSNKKLKVHSSFSHFHIDKYLLYLRIWLSLSSIYLLTSGTVPQSCLGLCDLIILKIEWPYTCEFICLEIWPKYMTLNCKWYHQLNGKILENWEEIVYTQICIIYLCYEKILHVCNSSYKCVP